MSVANIIAGLVFGAVGFVASVYGKRQAQMRTMGIGVALMAFPYFVPGTFVMCAVGTLLTAALFVFRD